MKSAELIKKKKKVEVSQRKHSTVLAPSSSGLTCQGWQRRLQSHVPGLCLSLSPDPWLQHMTSSGVDLLPDSHAHTTRCLQLCAHTKRNHHPLCKQCTICIILYVFPNGLPLIMYGICDGYVLCRWSLKAEISNMSFPSSRAAWSATFFILRPWDLNLKRWLSVHASKWDRFGILSILLLYSTTKRVGVVVAGGAQLAIWISLEEESWKSTRLSQMQL